MIEDTGFGVVRQLENNNCGGDYLQKNSLKCLKADKLGFLAPRFMHKDIKSIMKNIVHKDYVADISFKDDSWKLDVYGVQYFTHFQDVIKSKLEEKFLVSISIDLADPTPKRQEFWYNNIGD